MNLHVNVNSAIAGRLAMAAMVWVGLTAPASLGAMAQDATPMADAQDATPMASPVAARDVPLADASGAAVGLATFSESGDGVTMVLLIEGLAPGEHGWHLHEMGVCEPGGAEPFSSAGAHWNPTAMMHGGPDDEQHHAGDFGNFMANDEGLAEIEFTTTDFTLGEGPTSVSDEDGTAIIVHEGMDDLVTQPSGDSGARYACGVVAEPTMDMSAMQGAAATPVGTPEMDRAAATPVS